MSKRPKQISRKMSFKSTEKDSSSDHQQSGSNIKEEKDLENLDLAPQKNPALIKKPAITQMITMFEQTSISANIWSNQNDTISLDPSVQPEIQTNKNLKTSDSAEIKNSPTDDKDTCIMGNINPGSNYHTPLTFTTLPTPNQEFSLPTHENLTPMYANPINKWRYITSWIGDVNQHFPSALPSAGQSHRMPGTRPSCRMLRPSPYHRVPRPSCGMLKPSPYHRVPMPSCRMLRPSPYHRMPRPSAAGDPPPENPGCSGMRPIRGRRDESCTSPGLQRKSIEKPETKGAKRYETKQAKCRGLPSMYFGPKTPKNDESDDTPNFKPKKSEKEETGPRAKGSKKKKGKKDEDTEEDLPPSY